ncbi:MAG: S-layer homology domain-containing protein, partial [Bacillota bacterium]
MKHRHSFLCALIAALCLFAMPFAVMAADPPEGLYLQSYGYTYDSEGNASAELYDEYFAAALDITLGERYNQRVIYVDGAGKQTALTLNQLKVPDGVRVVPDSENQYEVVKGLDDTFLEFSGVKTGSFALTYSAGGNTWSLPIKCELPVAGFYAGPAAKAEDLLEEWGFRGADDRVYIAVRDGYEIKSIELSYASDGLTPEYKTAADKRSAEVTLAALDTSMYDGTFSYDVVVRNLESGEETDEYIYLNVSNKTAGIFVPRPDAPDVSDAYDLISEILYETTADGKEIKTTGFTSEYEYDSEGNILKETTNYESYVIDDSETWVYTYNKDGDLIMLERGYMKDGAFISMMSQNAEQLKANQPKETKDAAGNVIREDYDDGYAVVYTYDAKGNTLTETSYDDKGKETYRTTYTYNGDSTLKTKEETLYEGGTGFYTYKYENGRMSGFDYAAGGFLYECVYAYETAGDVQNVNAKVYLVSGGTKTLLARSEYSYKKAREESVAPAFRFVDVTDESKFYFTPVYWAVDHDPQITNGIDATHFGPDQTCTRGQVVTFLWRAKGCPEPASAKNPFKDVKTTDYFYKAVLWAVENGITNGTSGTTFSP